MKKIKFKCWVEDESGKLYGPGPNELIKNIQTEGSLSKAAEKMNMSYKKAWNLIQKLNSNSEEPWVILKKGGQHGGGAEITPLAIKAVQAFDNLELDITKLIDQERTLLEILK